MARTFDAGGAPLSEPFRVDTTIFGVTCCPYAYDDIKGSPEVSTASGGHFVVVWSGGYNQYQYFVHYRREMFGQVVAPGGNLEGPEFSAGGDGYYYSYLPDVATDSDGQFVVVWGAVTGYEYYYDDDYNLQRQGNYAMQARRYSGGGAGITPEVDVGPLGLEGPKVASHKDGDFVVTWTQPGKLLSRRYDAQAVPKGDAFEVSTSEGTSADTERREPNTAVADAGALVVVWTEGGDSIPESPDGSGAGIVGRTYAADGTARGEEIVVNAYTTGNQSAPAVAFTGPDDLVVTWESEGEIVARRFARAPACGDATADGARTATDALVALNAALGLANCASCVCDADDSERISATDALRILRSVVEGPILLSCAPC
jgi:hypothetical protein